MAEGGQAQNIYHVGNVQTLNVVGGQNITKIDNSTVGSVAVVAESAEQQDDVLAADNGRGRVQSDKVMGSQRQQKHEDAASNTEGVTWIESGKFGICRNLPLRKGSRVYRGRQQLASNSFREVAIKLIQFHENSWKEIDFLLKLRHPNIVQIIDAGKHSGTVDWIHIVMELCSQTLQNYIDENQNTPLDFKQSFSFAEQLATGIAFLHENKIIHRDLKPDNVLIDISNNCLKVSDFGLSKEIQDSRSVATVTSKGVGSEGYRSPETYQTGSKVTPRLDIFPLGLIFNLLFTSGKHPFGSDPYDWSYNIRKNQNLDLSKIPEFEKPNSEKKAQLLDLLNQMLWHEPRDRPTSDEVKNHVFFKGTDSKNESEKDIERQMPTIDVSQESVKTKLKSANAKLSEEENIKSSENEEKNSEDVAVNILPPITSSQPKKRTKPIQLSDSKASENDQKDGNASHHKGRVITVQRSICNGLVIVTVIVALVFLIAVVVIHFTNDGSDSSPSTNSSSTSTTFVTTPKL